MYRIVAWTSKGGSGKTTTTTNTAAELARLGWRVLAVGFDRQGNLERTFGIPDQGETPRLEDYLDQGADPTPALVSYTVPPLPPRRLEIGRRKRPEGGTEPTSLTILASSSRILEHEDQLKQDEFHALDKVLRHLDGQFDIALIDPPGDDSAYAYTAAHAADGILLTGQPGYFEFEGVLTRLAEIPGMEHNGHQVQVLGMLFNQTSANSRQLREYRAYYETAQQPPLHVFDSFIRKQDAVRDHPREGAPTVIVDPYGTVAEDYRGFAAELVERLQELAAATPPAV